MLFRASSNERSSICSPKYHFKSWSKSEPEMLSMLGIDPRTRSSRITSMVLRILNADFFRTARLNMLFIEILRHMREAICFY